ncbi:MAG TPA: hypothetical protein VIL09_13380 [Microvirga sp.]|jgi:tetratricopeptide (TPR) repeat protein
MDDETTPVPAKAGLTPSGEPGSAPAASDVRAALARVTASDGFRNAPQLVVFLRFVVDKVLAGEGASLKGYTIATQALGRPDNFDPQTDPIVRVEAGRLRRALDAYYAGAGAADPVRILIPRGTYVPVFSAAARELPAAPAPVAALLDSDVAGEPAPSVPESAPALPDHPRPRRSLPSSRWLVAAAILLALGVAAIPLALREPTGGWLDLVRAERPTASAAPQALDGRPVVAVGPIEVVGTPERFSPQSFRSMVLDGLARFDEIAVIDQDGTAASRNQGYVLNLRVTGMPGGIAAVARLTHEPSGKIVWARSFDPAKRPDLDVPPETDVARQIATSVGQPYGVLFADLRGRPALDERTRCIVQAYDYWNRPSRAEHALVRDCLEAVTTAQPQAATAIANLAYFYLDEYRVGHNARPEPLERALRAARRAVEIAPESPRTNQALMAVMFIRGDTEQALTLGRRALELNPFDTDIMADVGARLVQSGQYREGAGLIVRAAAANPADPPWYDFFLFLAAFMQDDWQTAKAAAGRIPTGDYVLGLLAKIMVAVQDGENADALLARLVAIQPDYATSPAATLAKRNFTPAIQSRLLEGLRRAGLRA